MNDSIAVRSAERGRGRPARPRVNIPCTLRPEQADGLRKLSAREDLPCSVLLRQMVDRMLREEGLLGESGL